MSKLGLNITEQEYRKLSLPSYSLLSDIEREGPIVITRPRVDISLEEPIIIGSIVDNYITDGDNLKKMYVVKSIPSEKPLRVIEEIIARKNELTNKRIIIHKDNQDLIDVICAKHDYYKTTKTRLTYLSKFKSFIDVMIQPHVEKPFIVTAYQKSQADRCVKAINLTFPFFNYRNHLGQIKLTGTVNGLELKCMFDMIIVDREGKRLVPFDLKTGFESYEEFIEAGFVGWNYYLQGSLYKEILLQNLKGTEYEGWEVSDFRFLYCGRADFKPLIFKMGSETHLKALEGFKYHGKNKRGLYDLIDDYKFYRDNPKVYYSREFIKQKDGRVILEKDIVL